MLDIGYCTIHLFHMSYSTYKSRLQTAFVFSCVAVDFTNEKELYFLIYLPVMQ